MIIALLLLAISAQAQTIRTVCSSGCDHALSALQDAVDAATCGDIIQITAGQTATQTGGAPLTLRDKSSCSANGPYITIRSSGVTNLTPGARVTPADASNLAKITMDSGPYTALANEKGAAWYRFHGIEFTAPSTFTGDLIEFGTRTPVVSYVADHEVADLAHHIVFDQCYFHGDSASTNGPRRAIRANLGHLEVINSWIENIKTDGNESNAIGGWNVKGPIYLENNHLEAAAITTLFGGAVPNIMGIRANGIFVRGNHYYRPWKLRRRSGTVDPTWDCLYDSNGGEYYKNTANTTYWRCDSGTWTEILVGAYPVGAVWQKNIFELKNAWRSVVEGNYFENAWNPANQNQFGAIFLFNLVDGDGVYTFENASTVGHVDIKNNYGRRAPWVTSVGYLGSSYFLFHNNIRLHNNVFDEIGDPPHTLPSAEGEGSKCCGTMATWPGKDINIAYTHNTFVSRAGQTNARAAYLFGSVAAGVPSTGAVFTANIVPWGEQGFNQDNSSEPGGSGGRNWYSVTKAFAPGFNFHRNVVVNDLSQSAYGRGSPLNNLAYNVDTGSSTGMPCVGSTAEMTGSGATYNGNCGFPAAWTDVGFTDYSAKNYKLTGSYVRWGPMGRTPGADTDVVGWSTSGVNNAGAVLPAYLTFQIRRILPGQTSVVFRYTAPTTAACTTTMSTKPDLSSPIIDALADGGGDLDRFQVDINGLSTNTRYYWRITCGDSTYREGIVTTLP